MGPPRAVIPGDDGRAANSHALPVLGGPAAGNAVAQRLRGASFHRVTASPRCHGGRNEVFPLHGRPGNRGLCNEHEGDERRGGWAAPWVLNARPSCSPSRTCGTSGSLLDSKPPAPAQHPPNPVTPAAGSPRLITAFLLRANSLSASNSLLPPLPPGSQRSDR